MALDWARDGATWPHHAASRFVAVGALTWHVQQLGPKGAPQALMIHGTGASSHSWRSLTPLLAQRFDVIQVDLPGHAFTATPAAQSLSLSGMAQALGDLLDALQVRPALVVGHSAGAAIAVRMVLNQRMAPAALVAINGALLPLHGVAGRVFSPVAQLLARQSAVPHFFAWGASQSLVLQRLIDGTGSRLDAEGRSLYGRLVSDPGHVAGALRMMASWNLELLRRDLPRLSTPLHLLAGAGDQTLPHDHSRQVHRQVPGSTLCVLPGLGHLAHEEAAGTVVAAMEPALLLALGQRDESGLTLPF